MFLVAMEAPCQYSIHCPVYEVKEMKHFINFLSSHLNHAKKVFPIRVNQWCARVNEADHFPCVIIHQF